MYERGDFETTFGITLNHLVKNQLKNIFEELVHSRTINLDLIHFSNQNPPNYAVEALKILPPLKKAATVLKLQSRPYFMTWEETRKFLAFDAEFTNLSGFKIQSFEYKVSFFNSLRTKFLQTNWDTILDILHIIFERSLPCDYKEWPDFLKNHNNVNFDDFINNVVKACVDNVNEPIVFGDVKDRRHRLQDFIDSRIQTNQVRLKKDIVKNTLKHIYLNMLSINNKLEKYGNVKPFGESGYEIVTRLIRNSSNYFPPIITSQKILVSYLTIQEITASILNKVKKINVREQYNCQLFNTKINYSFLFSNPFMHLLSKADEKLQDYMDNQHNAKIDALKGKILRNLSATMRNRNNPDPSNDRDFNSFFEKWRSDSPEISPLYKDLVSRMIRLYDFVKDTHDEETAATVIYELGMENYDRCIDGAHTGLLELEREYVYTLGNVEMNQDMDHNIQVSFAKLFSDHRTKALRDTIDNLYTNPEKNTYAWIKSHQALHLGFGLTGSYKEAVHGQFFSVGVDPVKFINAYVYGTQVFDCNDIKTDFKLKPFTLKKMTKIVQNNIKNDDKRTLFDDNMLDHMIQTNIKLRRAYTDFQNKSGDENFKNEYFKNANQPLRKAIKLEAILEIFHRYNYVSKRTDEWM